MTLTEKRREIIYIELYAILRSLYLPSTFWQLIALSLQYVVLLTSLTYSIAVLSNVTARRIEFVLYICSTACIS